MLPVIERIIEESEPGSLENVAIVGVQHLLQTTGSLIEACQCLGLRPENIFLLGKCYSTSPRVLDDLIDIGIEANDGPLPSMHGEYRGSMRNAIVRMWQRARFELDRSEVQKVIVLDDGGQCIRFAPNLRQPLVGVEQTTSGIKRSLNVPFPIVNVASSAAKRLLEPPMIAAAIVSRIASEVRFKTHKPIGVFGFGNIGQAITSHFLSNGHEVAVFDNVEVSESADQNVMVCRTPYEVLDVCDVVFGCAGEDVLPDCSLLSSLTGRKVLVSCSSGDIEFNSILKLCSEEPTLDSYGKIADVGISLPHGLEIRMVRAGFPANFDRSLESVPAQSIQLTRGLLLGGILQAGRILPTDVPTFPLDSHLQRLVATTWQLDSGNLNDSFDSTFADLDWIEAHSHMASVTN